MRLVSEHTERSTSAPPDSAVPSAAGSAELRQPENADLPEVTVSPQAAFGSEYSACPRFCISGAVVVLLPLTHGSWGSHSLSSEPKKGACWNLPPALW